jgi:hypothetical protein
MAISRFCDILIWMLTRDYLIDGIGELNNFRVPALVSMAVMVVLKYKIDVHTVSNRYQKYQERVVVNSLIEEIIVCKIYQVKLFEKYYTLIFNLRSDCPLI